MNLPDIVAKNIKTRRLAMGMSRKDLWRKMRIDDDNSSQIVKWERGDTLPSAYSLCELADALECTVDEILGRE